MTTWTLKAKQHLKNMITYIEWLDIDLTISRETRKQVLKDLVWDIKCFKRKHIQAFKIQLKYVKLGWMFQDET